MLEVKNLTKYYKDKKGIENLSFKLYPKEVLGMLGTNGSGKTTTFRLLLQLIQASWGEILIDGRTIEAKDHLVFGYLPEERSVFRDLKVVDQIRFLGRLKKIEGLLLEKNMDSWLDKLEIQQLKYRRICELSKGNQQKVQLICALIHDPKIIILDEPLTGLDLYNVQLFKLIFHQLQQAGKMILFSSHQYEYVEEFCEKIIYIQSGDVKFSGTLLDLKQESPFRYVSFVSNHDIEVSQKEGLVGCNKYNGIRRYQFNSDSKARKFVEKIIKLEDIQNIKFEYPTLVDLMKGNVL